MCTLSMEKQEQMFYNHIAFKELILAGIVDNCQKMVYYDGKILLEFGGANMAKKDKNSVTHSF